LKNGTGNSSKNTLFWFQFAILCIIAAVVAEPLGDAVRSQAVRSPAIRSPAVPRSTYQSASKIAIDDILLRDNYLIDARTSEPQRIADQSRSTNGVDRDILMNRYNDLIG